MRRAPRNLEEALKRAKVFEGRYTPEHLARSRQRITEKLSELRWIQQLATGTETPPDPHPPAALHERAAHDLRALCQGIIRDADAARRIARFDQALDPGGALAFACLLILADQQAGAQFWLQFAAGAGNSSAAVCLYLLHLSRGDLRDAEHWARQTAVLNDDPCQPRHYAPIAHRVLNPGEPPTMGVAVHICLPQDSTTVSEDAVRTTVQTLSVDQVDGLGPIHQPSPHLAHQLKTLVATTP
ncbi:hypothetical protein [Streptomyces sp. CAU 1734]|uniref:hypothetical protein n=1 Tax=Streptomyces sp. CAU 1734 TaxID=3140360 RepID=UPI00326061D4